ncbi:MAG: alpha/beta hydrolase [Wenzhouxiangellaceae bacterium]|nr:alpha/beta hydrolase [Wenzhouxiangellaceae bacterium]
MEIVESRTGAAWRRSGDPGARRALVLFHGLASNGSRWREFAETVEADESLPGWKIVAPDLRGHGRSARRGRIDSKRWARDFETMRVAEGIETLVLGGHCLGANLAIRIAAGGPKGLAGLVLVEPMVPAAWAGIAARWGRFRFILPPLAALARAANALGIGRRSFPELDLKASDIAARRMQADDDGHFNTDYASPQRDIRFLPTASYLAALHETLRPLPAPERIACPTLAMLSSGGLFGDPARTRAWLERIERIRIVDVAAQHWIPTEQPEAMRSQLLRFVSDLGRD